MEKLFTKMNKNGIINIQYKLVLFEVVKCCNHAPVWVKRDVGMATPTK